MKSLSFLILLLIVLMTMTRGVVGQVTLTAAISVVNATHHTITFKLVSSTTYQLSERPYILMSPPSYQAISCMDIDDNVPITVELMLPQAFLRSVHVNKLVSNILCYLILKGIQLPVKQDTNIYFRTDNTPKYVANSVTFPAQAETTSYTTEYHATTFKFVISTLWDRTESSSMYFFYTGTGDYPYPNTKPTCQGADPADIALTQRSGTDDVSINLRFVPAGTTTLICKFPDTVAVGAYTALTQLHMSSSFNKNIAIPDYDGVITTISVSEATYTITAESKFTSYINAQLVVDVVAGQYQSYEKCYLQGDASKAAIPAFTYDTITGKLQGTVANLNASKKTYICIFIRSGKAVDGFQAKSTVTYDTSKVLTSLSADVPAQVKSIFFTYTINGFVHTYEATSADEKHSGAINVSYTALTGYTNTPSCVDKNGATVNAGVNTFIYDTNRHMVIKMLNVESSSPFKLVCTFRPSTTNGLTAITSNFQLGGVSKSITRNVAAENRAEFVLTAAHSRPGSAPITQDLFTLTIVSNYGPITNTNIRATNSMKYISLSCKIGATTLVTTPNSDSSYFTINLPSINASTTTINCVGVMSGFAQSSANTIFTYYKNTASTSFYKEVTVPAQIATNVITFDYSSSSASVKYSIGLTSITSTPHSINTITMTFPSTIDYPYSAKPSCKDINGSTIADAKITRVGKVVTVTAGAFTAVVSPSVVCTFTTTLPVPALSVEVGIVSGDHSINNTIDTTAYYGVVTTTLSVTDAMYTITTKSSVVYNNAKLALDVSGGQYFGFNKCYLQSDIAQTAITAFTFNSTTNILEAVVDMDVPSSVVTYVCLFIKSGLTVEAFNTKSILTYKTDITPAESTSVTVAAQAESVFFDFAVSGLTYTIEAISSIGKSTGSISANFAALAYVASPSCVDASNTPVTTGFTYDTTDKVLTITLTDVVSFKLACTFTAATIPTKAAEIVANFKLNGAATTFTQAIAAIEDNVTFTGSVSEEKPKYKYSFTIYSKFPKSSVPFSVDLTNGKYKSFVDCVNDQGLTPTFTFADHKLTSTLNIGPTTTTYTCTFIPLGLVAVEAFSTEALITYKNVDNVDTPKTVPFTVSAQPQSASIGFSVSGTEYTFTASSTDQPVSGTIVANFDDLPYQNPVCKLNNVDVSLGSSSLTFEGNILNMTLTDVTTGSSAFTMACTFPFPLVATTTATTVVAQFKISLFDDTISQVVAAIPEQVVGSITDGSYDHTTSKYEFHYSLSSLFEHDFQMNAILPPLVFIDSISCGASTTTFDPTTNELSVHLGDVSEGSSHKGVCVMSTNSTLGSINTVVQFTFEDIVSSVVLTTTPFDIDIAVPNKVENSSSSDPLSAGAIVGIVLGSIAFISLLILSICFVCRHLTKGSDVVDGNVGTGNQENEMTSV